MICLNYSLFGIYCSVKTISLGVDYSGAGKHGSPNRGIQMSMHVNNKVNLVNDSSGKAFSRITLYKELRKILLQSVIQDHTVHLGIDHGLGVTNRVYSNLGIKFVREYYDYLSSIFSSDKSEDIQSNLYKLFYWPNSNEYRITEKHTKGSKSIGLFGVPGSVSKSTISGIIFLNKLLKDKDLKNAIHLWPFDGFEPTRKIVIFESFPTLFRKDFIKTKFTKDEYDSYVLAKWIGENLSSLSSPYWFPDKAVSKKNITTLEGWIMGSI